MQVQVPSLGQEDPLEKEMATYSSILAWRIPWTEEPGGVHYYIFGHTTRPMGSQFPNQGSNPSLLHWKCRVLDLQGSPQYHYIQSLILCNYFYFSSFEAYIVILSSSVPWLNQRILEVFPYFPGLKQITFSGLLKDLMFMIILHLKRSPDHSLLTCTTPPSVSQ